MKSLKITLKIVSLDSFDVINIHFIAEVVDIKPSKPLIKQTVTPQKVVQSKPEEKIVEVTVQQEEVKEGASLIHFGKYLKQFIDEFNSLTFDNDNSIYWNSIRNNNSNDVNKIYLDTIEKPKVGWISKPTPPKIKAMPKPVAKPKVPEKMPAEVPKVTVPVKKIEVSNVIEQPKEIRVEPAKEIKLEPTIEEKVEPPKEIEEEFAKVVEEKQNEIEENAKQIEEKKEEIKNEQEEIREIHKREEIENVIETPINDEPVKEDAKVITV